MAEADLKPETSWSPPSMARKQQDNAPAPVAQAAYKVVKREKDRWWEVRDPQDELVCVTVYKRGAMEVVRRLAA